MQKDSALLQHAVKFAREGNKTDAQRLLKAVLRTDPRNQIAWGWYIDTLPTDEECVSGLKKFLEIFPAHQAAQAKLQSLLASQPALSAAPPPATAQVAVPAQRGVPPPISPPANLPLKPLAAPLVPPRRTQPVQTRTMASLTIMGIIVGVCVFFSMSYGAWVATRYAVLSAQYKALSTELTTLQNEHANLLAQYAALEQNYKALATEYSDFRTAAQIQYTTLQEDYTKLQTEHTDLLAQHAVLEQDYNALSSEYGNFRTTAILPPYIYIHDREVEIAYIQTDQTISSWRVPFGTLEYYIEKGNLSRLLPAYLNLKMDTGKVIQVMDFRPYVVPDSFETVISSLYANLPDEYAFIREVWNIVTQLSGYSSEIKETPRYPLETFLAGGGDCEDTAILFASMILAAPVDWEVSLVYMDSNNPTTPQEMNHVIVYINTGTNGYHVETTSDTMMLPYPQGVIGWYYKLDH